MEKIEYHQKSFKMDGTERQNVDFSPRVSASDMWETSKHTCWWKSQTSYAETAFPATFVWDLVPPNPTRGCRFTNKFVYLSIGMEEVGFCKRSQTVMNSLQKSQSSHGKCWTERALNTCPTCGKLAMSLQTTMTTHRRGSLWGSDKNYCVGSLHLRASSKERISWKLSPTSNSSNWRNKHLSPDGGSEGQRLFSKAPKAKLYLLLWHTYSQVWWHNECIHPIPKPG